MSQSNKAADMARQNAAIAEGDRKFKQMEAGIYSQAGEDFQRKFFNMTRTERQSYGLPIKNYPSGKGGLKLKKKKTEWWSKCCKKPAYEYRSLSIPGKPTERYYRCRGCYHDCEVQKTKPRKKRGS